jgi:hypothetical protein
MQGVVQQKTSNESLLCKALVALTLFLASTSAFARGWERIYIPDAVCGDGFPYSVLVSKGDPQKLLVEFQGGGACWSAETCYGPNLRAWVHPIPTLPAYSVPTTTDGLDHPWKNHTVVYLPYCTGDVFAANHVANYSLGSTVHHVGYDNAIKSFAYINAHSYRMSQAREVLFFGVSAGGIGAILHVGNLDPYLAPNAKKVLIADSIGLHFGNTFWQKFTPALYKDLASNFAKIGMYYSPDDGFLASHLGPVLQGMEQKNWRVGILQNSRDIVMSVLFGEISMDDHEKLVLGNSGIVAQAARAQAVSVFIPRGMGHTILQYPFTADTQDPSGQTALAFAIQVYNSRVTGAR